MLSVVCRSAGIGAVFAAVKLTLQMLLPVYNFVRSVSVKLSTTLSVIYHVKYTVLPVKTNASNKLGGTRVYIFSA